MVAAPLPPAEDEMVLERAAIRVLEHEDALSVAPAHGAHQEGRGPLPPRQAGTKAHGRRTPEARPTGQSKPPEAVAAREQHEPPRGCRTPVQLEHVVPVARPAERGEEEPRARIDAGRHA